MVNSTGKLGDEKHCVVCGRRFGWRKRWATQWHEIRHCSSACRRRRLTEKDHALEAAILRLLAALPLNETISVDDAAREVGESWRHLRERAREAARRLSVSGEVEFVQGGKVVDPSGAKGPVGLRRRRKAT